MVCARRAQMCKSQKGQIMRNDLGTSKSWKCVQGWQAPHEATKNSVFTCEIMQCFRNHDNACEDEGITYQVSYQI
jgi:hypothetical protein